MVKFYTLFLKYFLIILFISLAHFAISCAQVSPKISYTTTNCGTPRIYTLYNQSTGADSSISKYYWRQSSSAFYFDSSVGIDSATITIKHIGLDTIWLVSIDTSGCKDSTFTILNTTSATLPRIYDDSSGTYNYHPKWYRCIVLIGAPDSFRVNLASADTLKNYRIIWGDSTVDDTGTVLPRFNSLTHLYDTIGSFDIKIITTSNNGCVDTIFGQVTNEKIPTAGVIGPPTGTNAGCAPHTVRFINNGSNIGRSTQFMIDYGDGETEILGYKHANDTLRHLYTKGLCSGTMSIIAKNSCGQSKATWNPIYINDKNSASFTVDVNNCDTSTPFVFYNTSATKYCLSYTKLYYWDFGDGTNTGWIGNPAAAQQVHYYKKPGFYDVMLLDSNPCGVDTFIDRVAINFFPEAGFTIDAKSGCFPLDVTVTDTSYGLYLTRQWNFDVPLDSNNISTDSIQKFKYTQPGTYTMQLKVSNGCGTRYDTATINVWGLPKADFDRIDNGCQPKNVIFSNNSTSVLSNPKYYWDFGNGDTSNSKDPSPKVYNNSDTFDVILIVNDTCGSDSITKQFIVYPNPVAGFNWDTVCYQNQTSFIDTSTITSVGGTHIQTWNWDFGDGKSSIQKNPNHLYADSGNYQVTLITNSSVGCTDTIKHNIYVVPKPEATLSITPNDSICLNEVINFDGTSEAFFGNIISKKLIFGNGDSSLQEDTTYIYPTYGNYSAYYLIENSFGCKDTATIQISVRDNPHVGIQFDTACSGQATNFHDTSSNATDNNISWNWDLDNDGITDDTLKNTSKIYNIIGAKKVHLTVISSFGCISKDSIDINVYPLPVSDFSVNISTTCAEDSITFTNNSTGSYYHDFYFGDGNSNKNITHSNPIKYAYTDSGNYTAYLIVRTLQGCIDSSDLDVVVGPKPKAKFSINHQFACAPDTFIFQNISEYGEDYFWYQNDSLTGTQFNRQDTFILNDTNAFKIKLIVANASVCPNDTFEMLIGTSKNPNAVFTNSPDSGCGPLLVNFTNSSLFSTSYFWDFGNGDTAISEHPTTTFNAAAKNDSIYQITLISKNWLGCPDTTYGDIKVFPNPAVDFIQSNTDSCGDLLVSFTNTSIHNAGGNINNMLFDWNFGNGISSHQKDTLINYVASSIRDSVYNIQLIGYSKNLCPDTAVKTVTVYPNAKADFIVNQTDSCGPFTVKFTNKSVPNNFGNISIMSFDWDFGNGKTSQKRDTNIQYHAALLNDSVYHIKLIATSEHGCPDTIIKTVRAFPKPKSIFTQSDTDGCGPLTINFQNNSIPHDTSSINDMTFKWDFGDGNSSTDINPTHEFLPARANDTVYKVKLIAYSEHGCADTFYSTVRVYAGPVANFGVNKAIACAPFNFTFTNLSYNADSFVWLADGNFSHTNDFNRTDSLVQNDTAVTMIGLIAYSSQGCPQDTNYMFIGTSKDPIATFTNLPDSGCGPLKVDFTNTSNFAIKYHWNFGNGDTSILKNPTETFKAATINDSIYHIKLIATNWLGCNDTIIETVKVFPNPEVDFTLSNTDSCGDFLVAFTNTSKHNAGGTLADMSFDWNFGNGIFSHQKDTLVNYIASQIRDSIYIAQLIGYSKNNCADTTFKNIIVYPNATANFSMNNSQDCGPFSVNFTNQSVPNNFGNISIMSFDWDFGNGKNSHKKDTTVQFFPSLKQDTIYNIKLIAYSEHGCPDTITKSVRTYPKPNAGFTQSDTAGCGPLLVNFQNISVPFDTGTIADMTFVWDFGNGKTSKTRDTSITYNSAIGHDTTYTIRLISKSEHGCLDTFVSKVTVRPNPSTTFTLSDTIGCEPLTIDFVSSGVNLKSYDWDFGDGTLDTGKNVTHIFKGIPLKDTTYYIKLVGASPYGCPSDTVYAKATAKGLPYAKFTPKEDSVCVSAVAQMLNNSLGSIAYYWDFGNGDTSTQVSPKSYFTLQTDIDTSYKISMIATNYNGCTDTAIEYVVVSPKPTAKIYADTLMGCGPLSVNFVDSSIFGYSYYWHFGNGDTSTLKNPTATFSNKGSIDSVYQISMVVSNKGACTDTSHFSMTVFPSPNINFHIFKADGCGPLQSQFVNLSTPNDTGNIDMMTFLWDFGNGDTATSKDANSIFIASENADSNYTIKLTAYTEHGCKDSLNKNVTVYPNPVAKFNISDTAACGPDLISFYNHSYPNDTGTIDIMSFVWDFGNGKLSYQKNDSLVFNPTTNKDTTFVVKLVALSEHGCKDTADSSVKLYPHFFSKFDTDKNSECGPMTVNFSTGYPNIISYFWDFGNGDTTSEKNPTRTYTNTGFSDSIYDVKHIGLSAFGCPSDTFYGKIVVLSVPKTDFTQNLDSLCGDRQITFSNQTVGANLYKWNFGNGDTSQKTHPTELFKASLHGDTTYTINLLAKSYQGCENSFQKTVTLFAIPTANFITDTSKGCTGFQIHFADKSRLANSYNWDFGNGNYATDSSSNQSFINNSLLDSIVHTKLIVSTNRNCKDSITKKILIYPTPTVNFSANNEDGCGILAVKFNNQSRPNDTGKINIMTFNWDFGNGKTTTNIHPASSFVSSKTQDSIYNVKLIGYSEHGCKDSIIKQIRVYPNPLASFDMIDSVGCGPLTTIFKNTSIPNDTGKINIMSFLWDFGNGIQRAKQDDTVTYISSLKNDSAYTVRLIGISEHHCKDTVYKKVIVNPKPVHVFTADKYKGCGILDVNFNCTHSNADTLFWDFGNGFSDTGVSPKSAFISAILVDSVYKVKVCSKSKNSCLGDTISKDITVHPQPLVNFTTNTDSLCGGGQIQYFNTTQAASIFNWNFGDGNTSTQSNPSHVFKMNPDKDTVYQVQLIATSIYGCKDTLTKTNTMFPMPRPRIVADKIAGCAPLTINFSDSSHLAKSYYWKFGDGTKSTQQNPQHTFQNSSIINQYFDVVLINETNQGCIDSSRITITVYPLPVPSFVYNKQNICDTSNHIFSNTSINASSYKWYFGDGDSANNSSPSHLYPAALYNDTTFKVSMIATTNMGCKDTLEKVLVVNPIIYAEALANAAQGCNPLSINFGNNSRNATSHYWMLGDGNISYDQFPMHIYHNPDTTQKSFKVTLVVSDKFGCTDTSFTQVNMFGSSIALATNTKIPDCNQAIYQFNNLSKGGKTYEWDFGDGSVSNLKAPQHVFPTSFDKDTTFTVRLISKTNNTCPDTAYLTTTVNPLVHALFNVNDTSRCGFMNVQFTNQSKNAKYYNWSFGNGVNTAIEHPKYTYSIPGSYQTTLIALDGLGCADTFSLPSVLNVYEIPNANFITDVNYLRLPENKVNFTDLSVASSPLNYNWNFNDIGSGINNISQIQNPSHDYTDSGDFNIQLIVDNNHCYDTVYRPLRIDYYYPIASFEQTPDSGCMPLEVQFTDNSLYSTSYQWYFGDGKQSNEQHPLHTYINPGTYTVTLITKGPGGIDDTTKTDVIKVNEKPFALFYSIPTQVYRPEKIFTLINESEGATNYFWDVFDKNNQSIFYSTEENPSPALEIVGLYNVRLIAENIYGCLDTLIRTNYLSVLDDGSIITPTAFTPNGDGRNDGFTPIMEGVSEDEYLFTVFNRWGEKMYETTSIYDKWDGTFNGEPCQIDMYVWQTKGRFISGKKFAEKGRVTLLR